MQRKEKKDDFLTEEDKIIDKEIEKLVAKYPEFKLKGYIITRGALTKKPPSRDTS